MNQNTQNPQVLGPPGLLVKFWPLLLLAAFVPLLAQPEIIVGYHWKIELFLAGLLTVSLIQLMLRRAGPFRFSAISKTEVICVILPVFLFTIWSSTSAIWAFSARNAMHHSLLWACYLIFYVLIRLALERMPGRLFLLKEVSLVVLVIGIICVIQYAGSVKPITSDFTYRYYKYSEVFAAFLPVFLVLAVKRKSRAAILAAAVAFIAWLSVLLSLSRTSFISGLCGIGLLILLILVFRRDAKYLKKLFACVGVLIAITVSTQAFFLVGEPTTLDRIALNENTDRKSMDVRFLYWGLAFESFKSKPITGVGADNYISDYRNARERYSSLDPENPVLESNEENLPERAHNEYLQILSELGFIGILLFAWFLIGIAVLFFIYRNGRPSMLTLGSIAGMTAFLVSALASSYSFRIPANGLSFFFLLALFVQSLKKETGPADQKDLFRRSGVKKWIVAAGLFVSGVMIVFSLVRGVSLMFLANSQNTQDKAISAKNLQTATYLDPGNGLFKYYEGARLLNLNKPAASIPPLRYAIDSGIATSAVYFSLISAQRIAGKEMEAANTYAEALRVYPRSVFLRTAYASFLRERGQHNLADAEYTTAMKIDSKQAKSWYLAFTEGLQELSTRSVKEPELLPSAELYPGSGALALVNYEILRDKQK